MSFKKIVPFLFDKPLVGCAILGYDSHIKGLVVIYGPAAFARTAPR
jgi:hypothetical protein